MQALENQDVFTNMQNDMEAQRRVDKHANHTGEPECNLTNKT